MKIFINSLIFGQFTLFCKSLNCGPKKLWLKVTFRFSFTSSVLGSLNKAFKMADLTSGLNWDWVLVSWWQRYFNISWSISDFPWLEVLNRTRISHFKTHTSIRSFDFILKLLWCFTKCTKISFWDISRKNCKSATWNSTFTGSGKNRNYVFYMNLDGLLFSWYFYSF